MTLFFRSLIADFRNIGAISPSSHSLSRLIADMAEEVSANCILEVGAGTGAITQHLIKTPRLGRDHEIIVLERSVRFFDHLIERYPEHQNFIMNADVCDLDPTTLPWRPRLIVSSIPLFSLENSKRLAVIKKFSQLLAPGGHWIQFTYAPRLAYFRRIREFSLVKSRFVLANLPPASVILLRRTALDQDLHLESGRQAVTLAEEALPSTL